MMMRLLQSAMSATLIPSLLLVAACGGGAGGSPGGGGGTIGTGGGPAASGAGEETNTSSGGGAGPADTWGLAPGVMVIVADTNRDGHVDADDLAERAAWSWKRGAFVVANLDDDDGDGVADAADEAASGAEDEDDLAPIRIELGSAAAAAAASVHVEVVAGADHARVLASSGGGFAPFADALPATGSILLGVEAKRFPGPDWDGVVRIRVEARDAGGATVAADEVALRAAPWIMLPSSAAPTAIHVATGPYQNQTFLADLAAATAAAGVTLLPAFPATHWEEMWMQDTMEIGYTQLPGRAPMHVALRANRGQDSYPRTLLGPDMGYLEIGAPRPVSGEDAWVDWYGNLEVSPPVPGWPLGRIYYGHDTATGVMLHPEVVAFLEAQAVQAPFWIDTSWLTIKHVDEILTFVPGPDGKPRMLVVSPREAGKLYPAYYGPYNQSVQAQIDEAVHGGTYVVEGSTVSHEGILALLGLDASAVVELPLFYTDGHNDWSNPINGLFLGGRYVIGDTYIYAPERAVTQDRIVALGIQVDWVNDAVYQDNLGNVHCGTNANRLPVVAQFVEAIPTSL